MVSQASLDLVLAHYLDGCDVSDVPDGRAGALAHLHQNAPNPFNPATVILLTLPASIERAVLTVHDLRGRLVRRLWDGALTEGPHRISWNGRDDLGRTVGSGVYVARLGIPGRTETIRMALVR